MFSPKGSNVTFTIWSHETDDLASSWNTWIGSTQSSNSQRKWKEWSGNIFRWFSERETQWYTWNIGIPKIDSHRPIPSQIFQPVSSAETMNSQSFPPKLHVFQRISVTEYILEELEHLEEAFQANRYSREGINWTQRPRRKIPNINQESKDFSGYASLLIRHNIGTYLKPKDLQDTLSQSCLYWILCSCWSVYVEITKLSTKSRISEHKRSFRLVWCHRSFSNQIKLLPKTIP